MIRPTPIASGLGSKWKSLTYLQRFPSCLSRTTPHQPALCPPGLSLQPGAVQAISHHLPEPNRSLAPRPCGSP